MEWYEILLIVLASLVVATGIVALFYRQFFKRFFDIVLGLIGIILTGIPMIFTAIGVRIFLGSPVIFKQERVGRNQKHFMVYKFRTMTDKRDASGELLPDSERFTTFGKILRKTSLDEFPQFFNVVKGDISLIGPRPMMPKYLPSDEKIRAKRFSIRPGITGMAQIHGRTNITYSQRFEYDTYYADHISLWNDTKLFFGTVFHILRSFVKKGTPIRPEDMEMLYGTVEYERLKAIEDAKESNAQENERLDVIESIENGDNDKVAKFESRPDINDIPISIDKDTDKAE